MCRAVPGAFRLARHVRESPHLGVEAAARLWPLKPWTRSQANTTQTTGLSERNKTGERHRWRGVTASDQMLTCVGVCMWDFPPKTKPRRDGCQSVRRFWWELGRGDEGMEDRRMETGGWGWRDNRVLTALVLHPDGVYTHGGLGGECLLLLIVTDLLLWCIFNLSIFKELSVTFDDSLLRGNKYNQMQTFLGGCYLVQPQCK